MRRSNNSSVFWKSQKQKSRPEADQFFMRRALALARRGAASVSPNPMVGALIVKDNIICGMGWHKVAGGPHAEIEALRRVGGDVTGGTLYVTLEPCNHTGRTGPCVDILLAKSLSRVVIAMRDPNPQVCGGGVRRLEQAGIDVELGVLEKEARELNRDWIYFVTTGKPLITIYVALDLNGRVLPSGDPRDVILPKRFLSSFGQILSSAKLDQMSEVIKRKTCKSILLVGEQALSLFDASNAQGFRLLLHHFLAPSSEKSAKFATSLLGTVLLGTVPKLELRSTRIYKGGALSEYVIS